MTDLDEKLKQALGRVEPPPGFAERVLAALPDERPVPVPLARTRRVPLYVLAAAATVVVALGGLWLAAPWRAKDAGPEQVAQVPQRPSERDVTEALPPQREVTGVPSDSVVKTASHAPRPKPTRLRRTPARRATAGPVADIDMARAKEARDQLYQALRITAAKLNLAQKKINDMNREPQS